MNRITLILCGTLVVTLLGVFIGGAGIRVLVRRSELRRGWLLVLLALGLLSVAGGTAWRYRQGIEQLFQSDYLADPQRLQELQNASLDSQDGPRASADDWPQWRGVHRDGISPETGLLSTWPTEGPRVVWRKPIKGGYSSLAIAGGRVFTMDRDGTSERVLCLDAATGKDIWVFRYDFPAAQLGGADRYPEGPRATPTVVDGRVYTVGATGLFHCLEANPPDGNPRVLWQKDLLHDFRAEVPTWGVACSPLVEGNLVVVQPGGSEGSVAAFDRVTGDLVWKALADVSGYSSPVAATAAGTRQIICFTGNGLVGLRPADGRQLWYFSWATQHDCNVATPIVAGDYVFLSSDYGSGCALLQLVAHGDGVQAERVYVRRNKLMRSHFSTCVLRGGYLYGFDVSGYGGSGLLKCVDLRTAEEKWTTRDLRESGCLIYADGHLLILTVDGSLSLVEATPERFVLKSQVKVLQGPQCWALPALAGGRLYLRDNHELVCLDLKQ